MISNDAFTSWKSFVEAIGLQFLNGMTDSQIASQVSGRTVRWEGIIDRVQLNKDAPGAAIDMEACQLQIGLNRTVQLDCLYLPIDSQFISNWERRNPGERIVFEATLGTGAAPFPAIELHHLPSGKSLISVRLFNARLLESS